MIFFSIAITITLSALKFLSIIDWHLLIVCTPVLLDLISILIAKIAGKEAYVKLMLCNPLNIKSAIRATMIKGAR